jgi:hypothetical protein
MQAATALLPYLMTHRSRLLSGDLIECIGLNGWNESDELNECIDCIESSELG